MEKWEKHVEKLKAKNIPVKDQLRFMDARDVERHATWKELLSDITERVGRAQTAELNDYCQLGLLIISTFGSVSHDYFTAVVERAFSHPLK